MNFFPLLPMFFILIYLGIFFLILFIIYRWVNKFISLKQEQNDLLRQIVEHLKNNQHTT